jgi:serine O-acetyltransferase
MSDFLQRSILDHSSLLKALGHCLAAQLIDSQWTSVSLNNIIREALESDSQIIMNACLDLSASFERDTACDKYLMPLLYYKGFQALQLQRVANWFWKNGRNEVTCFLQSRMTEVFHVDIHPRAKIGSGVMLDHATGLVIGNNVSVLHSVTLGGNGNKKGKRHPTIGDGVMISAGARIIGNVSIG